MVLFQCDKHTTRQEVQVQYHQFAQSQQLVQSRHATGDIFKAKQRRLCCNMALKNVEIVLTWVNTLPFCCDNRNCITLAGKELDTMFAITKTM